VQKGTFLLTIKYKGSSYLGDEFQVVRPSNLQALEYFDFIHDPNAQIVYMFIKSCPLPVDKSGISFLLSIRNKLMSTTSGCGMRRSYTTVTVSLFYTSSRLQVFPVFIAPTIDRNVIYVNLMNSNMISGTNVAQLSAYVPAQNSNITFRILNKGEDLFYIDAYNNLRITYPFPESVNIKRFNYLVFISIGVNGKTQKKAGKPKL
jgi:hypothetical protein